MSTGMDISFVRERYRNMPDEELIWIATQNAGGLTQEAKEIVKAEIHKRGLNEAIYKGVEAQNKEYSIEEIDAYCDAVSILNCPCCGTSSERLNATMTAEAVSFILFTSFNRKIIVACPHCLNKANNNALIKTIVLGWWAIPWGIVRTIQAILLNLKSKRTNRSFQHNDYLRTFTLNNVGELEAYRDNKEKLQEIIVWKNQL